MSRIMRTGFIFFLLLCSLSLFCQVKPDSIIYSADSVVIARLFMYSSTDENAKIINCYEYRFYTEDGFYCLSLKRKENGAFYKIRRESLVSEHYRINPDKNIVFLSDTFEIGFLNRLKKDSGRDFEEKFKNTLEYYYTTKDYRDDIRLAKYINELIEKHDLIIKEDIIEEDTTKDDEEEEVFFCNWPTCCVPHIYNRTLSMLTHHILNEVRISKRHKRKMDKYLCFAIETDRVGRIKKIERLTDINTRINSKIDDNVLSLSGKWIHPSSPTGRATKLKAAFYIDFNR